MDFNKLNLPKNYQISDFNRYDYLDTKNLIKNNKINTVCESANCPNRYECFSKKTATFLIMGEICTRNCLYCDISSGEPTNLNKNEPKMIAETVKKLNLNYVVITSVTRDDLFDQGISHFIDVINNIKKIKPNCKIEILIPDFIDNLQLIDKLIESNPDVINHNIETTFNLFNHLRPKGDYNHSLNLLKKIDAKSNSIITKSGFMVGFGETFNQIKETINDLHESRIDILTVGQYIPPSKNHYPVKKFYSESEFNKIKSYAKNLGINYVFSNPFVRSSYKAFEVFENSN